MNNKTIIEFCFRIIWRIREISERVILEAVTPSLISIIVHNNRSPCKELAPQVLFSWVWRKGHSQEQGWSTTEGKRKIIQSISICPLFSCNLSSVTGKWSLVNMTVSHIDHELNSPFIFWRWVFISYLLFLDKPAANCNQQCMIESFLTGWNG